MHSLTTSSTRRKEHRHEQDRKCNQVDNRYADVLRTRSGNGYSYSSKLGRRKTWN